MAKRKDTVRIECAYTEMISLSKIIPNPRNPNTHPDEQIERLAHNMKMLGIRSPIVISTLSGFIVKGHARLMAAQRLGLTKFPVDKQDYADESSEWADLLADNRIAELADMDIATLKDILQELDTGDFDMDLTGWTITELEQMMAPPLNPYDEWGGGMPEYYGEDKRGFRTLIVHIQDQEALDKFEKLMEQPISEKAKYIWYPELAMDDMKGKVYDEES